MGFFTKRFEDTTAQDKFYDYCLWEYLPVAPISGKFRSINLLLDALEYAEADERWYAFLTAIRKRMGRFCSVFGVKYFQNRLFWEFYFYDYEKRKRKRSISRVIDTVRPFTSCPIRIDEQLPYFMFSIDVDDGLIAGQKALDEIHMYMEHPGSRYASGICYSLTEKKTTLENFYFFFKAATQMKDVVQKLSCSAYFDAKKIDLKQILWPEMQGCQVIVTANKQKNDSIYFSRVTIDQFIFFLKKMKYPHAMSSFVEKNRHLLDHLLYDVSFDYTVHEGHFKIIKSGYYGFF